MIDLFCEWEDSNVAIYADYTTPYSCATDIPSLALELQASATKQFGWFKNNHLKANPGKSNILLSSKKPEIVSVDGIPLAASSHEKLLGVTIDWELKFENHISELYLKVSKRLNALCRISSTMSLEKHITVMKVFIESKFSYCPLISMLYSRTLNNKINEKNNETIPYDLRMRNESDARNPKTVRCGTETISFLSPKIWSLIPQNIKDFTSSPCFKKKHQKIESRLPMSFMQNIFATYWFYTAL